MMNFPMHQDSAVDIEDISVLPSKPCIRRSNRERKQTVTVVAESHRRRRAEKSQLHDIGMFSTSLLFSPPTKKRKKASAKSSLPILVTPPSSQLHPHSNAPAHGKRADNSLAYLAYRFSQYIQNQPHQVIDVKDTAEILQVERRRLYDVTNILEGAGLVKKLDLVDSTACNTSSFASSVGSYRWIVPTSTQEQLLQDNIELLHTEEGHLDHWIDLIQSHTDVLHDSITSDLHITSEHLQGLLPPDESFLAIVSPPGSQLSNDASHPHAVTVHLPSTYSSTPQAFLMESNLQRLVKLDLGDAFLTPPLLDTCASGFTVDSSYLLNPDLDDGHVSKEYGDCQQWEQGFPLPTNAAY